MLEITCPVRTAPLRSGIVRKRSMMPVCRSRATYTAVDAAPKPAHSRMIPGTT